MSLHLSLRQLVVFREVMRRGSVSDAAQALHRSQPALSAMLAGMERQLGFELFVRHGNRLVPKPEAHFFLEEVDRVLDSFGRAVDMMGAVARLHAGPLRIACMPAASLFLVPRLVSEFVRDRPGVQVTLMSNSSVAVHDWVASQQFDVGIAELPSARESLTIDAIETDCVCALRRDDPLARRRVLTPADLDGRPMAALFDEHFTHVATAQAFAAAGTVFNRRFELRAFVPGFDFVEQGLAVCLCDPISAASYRIYRGAAGPLVFRRFEPRIAFPFGVLTPAFRPPSLLAQAFCASLRERIVELISDATAPGAATPARTRGTRANLAASGLPAP